MITRTTIRAELMKAIPDGLFSRSHDLCGYATVEVPDRDGDLIRVHGVRLALFKSNGSVPLVGAAHRYSATANGDYLTAGKVTEFVRTTKMTSGGRTVAALAFGADWERDGSEPTGYAKKLKNKYDQKILNSFSVGADVFKAKQRDGGRYDIEDSDIYEISCCLIPTNFEATIMRALKAEFGEEFDEHECLHEAMRQHIQRLEKKYDGVQTELLPLILKAMNARMDDLESAIVAASEGRRDRPATDDSRPLDKQTAILAAVRRLEKQLSE